MVPVDPRLPQLALKDEEFGGMAQCILRREVLGPPSYVSLLVYDPMNTICNYKAIYHEKPPGKLYLQYRTKSFA